MNDTGGTPGGRGRPRPARRQRAGALAAIMVAIAGLAAACGGSSGSAGSLGHSNLQIALAYAGCMRSHGAPNWPDPNSQGTFVKTSADHSEVTAPASAYKACQHLLPNGARSPLRSRRRSPP